MKIIRKGRPIRKYTYVFLCYDCESIFELDERELPEVLRDRSIHRYGIYYCTCPVCGEPTLWCCKEVRYHNEDN